MTFLACDVAEAVRIGLEAAEERGLIDEIDLHIAPVLLGAGIRLFDNPGGSPVRLELLDGDDRMSAVNVATTRSEPGDRRRNDLAGSSTSTAHRAQCGGERIRLSPPAEFRPASESAGKRR